MSQRSANRPVFTCACGDHVFVALTRGYMTMVSPEDAGLLSAAMSARVSGTKAVYAAASAARKDGGGYLHRMVLRPRADQDVDHISGDTMDNRRRNLRACSHAENMRNSRPQRRRDLPKGVTRDGELFRAQIVLGRRKVNLGRFPTPEEAHAVYAAAARQHFGEFARVA